METFLLAINIMLQTLLIELNLNTN